MTNPLSALPSFICAALQPGKEPDYQDYPESAKAYGCAADAQRKSPVTGACVGWPFNGGGLRKVLYICEEHLQAFLCCKCLHKSFKGH